MQFLWKYIDDLVGKGLEWYLIAELLFYASATFVPLALPLAILLSSLMTFGNLGEHYELVSMKAAGVSLQKAMRPLVIVSILISLLAFYFSNNILPIANLKFQSLYYDIREKKMAFNIKEGIFYHELDGYTIRIGEKESDDIHIKDITIYNHTQGLGNIDVTIAKSGKMETTPDGRYMIFTLYDGHDYVEKVDESGHRKNRPFERSTFKEKYVKFDLGNFEMGHIDESLFKKHYMMLNIKQLMFSVDSLKLINDDKKEKFISSFISNLPVYNKIDSSTFLQSDTTGITNILPQLSKFDKQNLLNQSIINSQSIANNIKFSMDELQASEVLITKFIITIHEKFTLSFACFNPLFYWCSHGRHYSERRSWISGSNFRHFLYYLSYCFNNREKICNCRNSYPEIGMWLASAILLPIGIFLTYKATNDAPLLDADNYRKLFRAIANLIGNTER